MENNLFNGILLNAIFNMTKPTSLFEKLAKTDDVKNTVTTREGYMNFVKQLGELRTEIDKKWSSYVKTLEDVYGISIHDLLDNIYKKATEIYNNAVAENSPCTCNDTCNNTCNDEILCGCEYSCDAPSYMCDDCVCNDCIEDCDECPYDGDDEDQPKPSERVTKYVYNRAKEVAIDYIDEEIYKGDCWDENDETNKKVIEALSEFACYLALKKK